VTDLLTPLLTVVSALAGGYLAARLAVLRLRKQRAFDRRLQWYERSHRRTVEAWHEVKDALSDAERDPAFVPVLRSVLQTHLRTVRQLRTVGVLYASPQVYKRIASILREHHSYLTTVRESGKSEDERSIMMARQLSESLISAAYAISAEVRSHLQLEPLPFEPITPADALALRGRPD
jgi:hypothetical protein